MFKKLLIVSVLLFTCTQAAFAAQPASFTEKDKILLQKNGYTHTDCSFVPKSEVSTSFNYIACYNRKNEFAIVKQRKTDNAIVIMKSFTLPGPKNKAAFYKIEGGTIFGNKIVVRMIKNYDAVIFMNDTLTLDPSLNPLTLPEIIFNTKNLSSSLQVWLDARKQNRYVVIMDYVENMATMSGAYKVYLYKALDDTSIKYQSCFFQTTLPLKAQLQADYNKDSQIFKITDKGKASSFDLKSNMASSCTRNSTTSDTFKIGTMKYKDVPLK